MKRAKVLLLCGLLVVFAVAGSFAATEVVVDNITGGAPGTPVRFTVRLTYTPGDSSSLKAITNGFRVWTTSNGYTDNFSPINFDTFALGWDTLFDGYYALTPFSVDGIGEDTVRAAFWTLFAPGIPDGFDELVWWIETTPTMAGDTLCIDSSWSPPEAPWLWSTDGPLGSFPPTWYGPYCLRVGDVPGDLNCDGSVNIADLSYFVDYLFRNGPPPQQCITEP